MKDAESKTTSVSKSRVLTQSNSILQTRSFSQSASILQIKDAMNISSSHCSFMTKKFNYHTLTVNEYGMPKNHSKDRVHLYMFIIMMDIIVRIHLVMHDPKHQVFVLIFIAMKLSNST